MPSEILENISFLHSIMNFAYLNNIGYINLIILGVPFMWVGYKASLWIINGARKKKIIGWAYFAFVNFIVVAFVAAVIWYDPASLTSFFWKIFWVGASIVAVLLGWVEYKMLQSNSGKKKITGQVYFILISLIAAMMLGAFLASGVIGFFTHDLFYPAHTAWSY